MTAYQRGKAPEAIAGDKGMNQSSNNELSSKDHPIIKDAKQSSCLLCTMSEAAKKLGVSRSTLWRMTRLKRIGRVEIMPGSYRIRIADIEALAATTSANQEVAQ